MNPGMAGITIRLAARDDIPAIVDMLTDDLLGATRESPDDLTPYYEAFAAIDTRQDQMLIVAERDGHIAATAQMTFMAGLSHRGMTRAEIEAVRVHRTARGSGLGSLLIRWCIECARRHGCGMVQLTSNASRADAHRFYARLGFEQSHVGFKMKLPPG